MAADPPAGLQLLPLRGFLAAAFRGLRTAGMEAAARRRIQRARQLAPDVLLGRAHRAFAVAQILKGRHRGQQGARIGMGGLPEQTLARALFHKAPQIHDQDVGAHEAHHGQIVGK